MEEWKNNKEVAAPIWGTALNESSSLVEDLECDSRIARIY